MVFDERLFERTWGTTSNNSRMMWGAGFVLFLILLVWWARIRWRWVRRSRAAGWPMVEGRIEQATVEAVRRNPFLRHAAPDWRVDVGYSYSIGGQFLSGRYERHFSDEDEAQDFVRGLKGKRVEVHYNPSKLEESYWVSGMTVE